MLQYLKNVSSLYMERQRCTGCGLCATVCPQAVFRMDGDRVFIQNRDRCMECGACSRNCPSGAIRVDAGVGCATALINNALGRSSECCCLTDQDNSKSSRGGCC